jgi:hypothetical protein
MTPENRNSSLLGNGSVNSFPRKRARNKRRAVFSVVRAARVATQRCGKHISAAVNQHAVIEEAVFSVWAAPKFYNEEFRSFQLQQKTERVSEVDSWQNN